MAHILPDSIRVLVVDHNPILLEGIASLIGSQPDMLLVGTATTAEAGFALYLQTLPEFVLLDLDLPSAAGIDTVKRVIAARPGVRVIGLTTYELDKAGLRALAAGAVAIVAKDQVAGTLPGLIRKSRSH